MAATKKAPTKKQAKPAKKKPAPKKAAKTATKKATAAEPPPVDLDPGRPKVDGLPSIYRWCAQTGGSQRELGAKLNVTQSGLQRMLKPREPRDIRVREDGGRPVLVEVKQLTG
jgi:hypothetical protein